MGLLYTILTTVLLKFGTLGDIPYSTIDTAFENNNYKALSDMGKDKMVISIEGTEGVYSKSQASLILKDFFTRHPCTGFDFTFKGKANSEGAFAIGNYQSSSGKFRVSIHIEAVGSAYKIESLTIEKA